MNIWIYTLNERYIRYIVDGKGVKPLQKGQRDRYTTVTFLGVTSKMGG